MFGGLLATATSSLLVSCLYVYAWGNGNRDIYLDLVSFRCSSVGFPCTCWTCWCMVVDCWHKKRFICVRNKVFRSSWEVETSSCTWRARSPSREGSSWRNNCSQAVDWLFYWSFWGQLLIISLCISLLRKLLFYCYVHVMIFSILRLHLEGVD